MDSIRGMKSSSLRQVSVNKKKMTDTKEFVREGPCVKKTKVSASEQFTGAGFIIISFLVFLYLSVYFLIS